MLNLSPALRQLLSENVHRLCQLYVITRADGAIFRFTTHDAAILYANHTYTPVGGLQASARQRLDGLRDRNWEGTGVINSDAITFQDLKDGRYRKATVQILTVDWRYPWADPFETNTYYITSTVFDGEVWQAQMEGITQRLKQAVGRTYKRNCDAEVFGGSRCNVAGGEAAFTQTGTVTGLNDARRDFVGDVIQATNYFKHGYIRWHSGSANSGLTMEINRSYGTGRIVLWIPMPNDILIGDEFGIVAGCDRTLATCRDKFNNVANFKGFPFIPGTDALLKTPDSKS